MNRNGADRKKQYHDSVVIFLFLFFPEKVFYIFEKYMDCMRCKNMHLFLRRDALSKILHHACSKLFRKRIASHRLKHFI